MKYHEQMFDKIIMGQPEIEKTPETVQAEVNSSSSNGISMIPLRNPLDPLIDFTNKLLAQLEGKNAIPAPCIENDILEKIRITSEADWVCVLQFDQNQWAVKSQSLISERYSDQPGFMKEALAKVLSVISSQQTLADSSHHHHSYIYEDVQATHKTFIAFPLHKDKIQDFLIVYGLNKESHLLTTVYIHILTLVYQATRGFTFVECEVIEAAILDGLKSYYGYLPLASYNRRYKLFCQNLETMSIFFQPILFLQPHNIHISSWEALAREPESRRTPTDLFLTGELWGYKFMTELDSYFVRTALKSYRQALNEAKMQSPYAMQTLSVNVYPESIINPDYYQAVKDALYENDIIPEKLILEISEKTPIPKEVGTIDDFKQELERYVKDLHIGFAIDDFGVGHSSVSRLAKLNPSYVKIDREILHHSSSDITIQYVINVVTHGRLQAQNIVVEGFDSESRVTLKHLYQLGIRYIQGYAIGRPNPQLYRLEKEAIESIENLLLD